MEEKWKPIQNYEGLYLISNLGNVYSIKKKRIIRKLCTSAGYYQAELWKDGVPKWFLISRLVANEFIPNPNNLPYVNHKDENPLNNAAINLEWCDHKYNLNYGTTGIRMSKSHMGKHNGSHTNHNKVWINNGSIRKMCCKENLDYYLSMGFKQGKKLG